MPMDLSLEATSLLPLLLLIVNEKHVACSKSESARRVASKKKVWVVAIGAFILGFRFGKDDYILLCCHRIILHGRSKLAACKTSVPRPYFFRFGSKKRAKLRPSSIIFEGCQDSKDTSAAEYRIEDSHHDLCNQSKEQEEAPKGMPHRFEQRKGFETQVQWEGSLGCGISIEGILDDGCNE